MQVRQNTVFLTMRSVYKLEIHQKYRAKVHNLVALEIAPDN